MNEPLLIILIRKLIAKGDRIWYQGACGAVQVERIATITLDQSTAFGEDRYSGPAYNVKVHNGIGLTMTPHIVETKYDLVKQPKPPGQEWIDWDLVKISPMRRVEEAKVQSTETPLIVTLLQQELTKGNKVLVDYRTGGPRHEGVATSVRLKPNPYAATIMYEDDGVQDFFILDNATADDDVTLWKNPDGILTLTNATELDEAKAEAPIWVDLVNMLANKGQKVLTWDGDDHSADGIVCRISKAKFGNFGHVYLKCDYDEDWPGNGALAGTDAGEIVCDGDLDNYRLETKDGSHWLLAPWE